MFMMFFFMTCILFSVHGADELAILFNDGYVLKNNNGVSTRHQYVKDYMEMEQELPKITTKLQKAIEEQALMVVDDHSRSTPDFTLAQEEMPQDYQKALVQIENGNAQWLQIKYHKDGHEGVTSRMIVFHDKTILQGDAATKFGEKADEVTKLESTVNEMTSSMSEIRNEHAVLFKESEPSIPIREYNQIMQGGFKKNGGGKYAVFKKTTKNGEFIFDSLTVDLLHPAASSGGIKANPFKILKHPATLLLAAAGAVGVGIASFRANRVSQPTTLPQAYSHVPRHLRTM